jgi:hypothetical protein
MLNTWFPVGGPLLEGYFRRGDIDEGSRSLRGVCL